MNLPRSVGAPPRLTGSQASPGSVLIGTLPLHMITGEGGTVRNQAIGIENPERRGGCRPAA